MVAASGKAPDDDGSGTFESQSFEYAFDGAGNRTKVKVTADSLTSVYDYTLDLQGLPLSMSAAGTEEDLSFEHSARGFLTKVTAPGGTPVHQRFTCDSLFAWTVTGWREQLC